MEQQAACAHMRVERFTVEKDGRVFEEQWRCGYCGTKFVSLGSLFGGPQQIRIMEPMKTLRDEFAMAALTGLISTATAKIGASDIRAVTFLSYQLADSMMEARKQ